MNKLLTLLNWTPEELAAFRFEMAVEYLEVSESLPSSQANTLMQSTPFWKWWNDLLDIKDQQFVDAHSLNESKLPEKYTGYISHFISADYMSSSFWENNHELMITDVLREVHKKQTT